MTRPVRTPFVRDGTLGRDWDGTFDAKPRARRQTGRVQVRRDWDGTRGFAQRDGSAQQNARLHNETSGGDSE